MTHRVLITGGLGFVGHALSLALLNAGFFVRISSRRAHSPVPCGVEFFRVADDGLTNWRNGLKSVNTVVHCAARVHVKDEIASDPLVAFRAVNVSSTLELARQAANMGIKRFVFVSSIGVNGAETFAKSFAADDEPSPHSPYAVSKYEAELGLRALSAETDMEVVVVRPPLVYGPNAPGNFGSLVRWLEWGVPLPFGAVTENRRSLIALDNLVDLLLRVIDHPAAANQTFLAADGEDVSTADLVRRMGFALGRPACLLSVSPGLLRSGASLLGRGDVAKILCSSLQIDIAKTRELLNWTPPVCVDEALRRALSRGHP